MPNWCRNVIKCEKDVIQKIKNKYLYEASSQESQSLDFQKICPMPKELDKLDSGPESRYVPIYLAYLYQTNLEKYTFISGYLKSHMNDFHQKMYFSDIQYLIEKNEWVDEEIKRGKEYVDLFLKYGVFSWFDWCIDHWGTKWNSSEGNIQEDDSIAFTTAWNPPCEILRKLSEEFPDSTFYCYYAEEGSKHGYFEINAGWISNIRGCTDEEINDVLTSY